MRKFFVFFLCFGVLAAVSPAAARTSSDFHRFSIGAGGGFMTTPDYGSGAVFGGSVTYGITKNFALELRGSHFLGNVPGKASGLSKGELTSIPIQLGLQARYPVTDALVPYLTGGGGFYLNDFTLDASIVSQWSAVDFRISETMDNCIGFHFGGGVDYLIAPKIILNLDVRFSPAKAEGRWTLADIDGAAVESRVLRDLDLNPLAAALSIRYGF